jgi:GntR family transcriptional regulator/MocR family aminotransferase
MEIPIRLDREQPEPLYRQMYDQIREGVLTGRLAPGTRLPSTRELAARLQVGRITVTAAYDRLTAEGYTESRVGSGTVVASVLPDARIARRQRTDAAPRPGTSPLRLSRRMEAFPLHSHFPRSPIAPVRYEFRLAQTDIEIGEWRRLLARHLSMFEPTSLLATPPQGDPGLRRQLALYLAAARAVRCEPDQIFISSSDQHALNVVAFLALDSGDHVLVEEPGRLSARLLFQANGAVVVPVPVDAEGVDPATVKRASSRRTRLLYVSPSHQFPTGATLALRRRAELLDWAASTGTFIVEDDQNSEFRYGGATLESLQGLDTDDVVVYLGSLSRVVENAVRVAYLVVPPALVEPLTALRSVIDRAPPLFTQSALAELMTSGLFARHLRRMQRHHRARRDALRAALRECFGDDVEMGQARAGIEMHVRWRHHPVTDELIDAALAADIGLESMVPYYASPPADDPGVLMSYGRLDEQRIREGIHRLADVLAELPGGRAT